MLIEFHVIQDHGPSNMNRGQDGRPKTAFYAGTQRLRISSQCRKRTLREPRRADRRDSEPGVFEKTVGSSHFGVRTRLLPEKVAEKWREQHGEDAPFLEGIKAAVSVVAKKDGKQDEIKSDGRVRTPQAIYIDLDREVERIVAVLNELHESNQLESLADESQVFAEHLKVVAEELAWEGKDPSKQIAWESIKDERNWEKLTEALDDLDPADRPNDFDATITMANLVPTYHFAVSLLKALQAIKLQDEKKASELLRVLAPARGSKKKSGAKISLADRLKLTADQPVSAADIALFGRMTTSDAFRDVEAACQVADSLSTHPVDIEDDYFTAVDDLDTGSGAAYASRDPAQFASAVFYHYLSVDYCELLRNLGAKIPAGKEDDEVLKDIAADAPKIAARTIEGLLRAMMCNVPSGKINSHGHNQQPSLILVEVKQQHHATNYLTAFHDPARAGERADGSVETLLTDSVRKLISFARYRDRKMKIEDVQRFLFVNDEPTEKAIERLRESLKQGDSSPLTDDDFFKNSSLAVCEEFGELVSAINAAVQEGGAKC